MSDLMWGTIQGMTKEDVIGVRKNQITEKPHGPQEESGLDLEDNGEPLRHFKQERDKTRLRFQKYGAESKIEDGSMMM